MPKALWLLVVAMILNITGASFIWPLNTIYLHQHLGQSLSVAGLVLMGNAGAGVVGSLLGGYLFDRIGAYRTLLLGIGITLVHAIILTVFQSFFIYVIVLIGLGLGAGITFPALYALAGVVWPEGERKAFNAMYVAQNVGVALGTALAGIVASIHFDFAFYANAFLYGIFFVMAIFVFRSMDKRTEVQVTTITPIGVKPIAGAKKQFAALMCICVAFFVCWVAYVQWQSTISVHTQTLGVTLTEYSLLWTINGLMIVLAQPVVNLFIKRFVRTLEAQIYTGIAIFILSFFALTQASMFSGFLVAMVILTIGEMFVWPAVPTIAHKLAPKGKEGFYQGIVNSAATGGRMVGPFLGGMLADFYGMNRLFYVFMGIFLLAVVATTVYQRLQATKGEPIEEGKPAAQV